MLASVHWHQWITATFSPAKFSMLSTDLAFQRVRDAINWLGGLLHRPLAWIFFTEPSSVGHVHAHGLVQYTDDRRPTDDQIQSWDQWWRKKNGFVKIEKYEQGLGGAEYVSKLAGSPETDWDCSKSLIKVIRQTPIPSSPSDNRCRVVR
jgi:hypothetical protein